MAWVLWAAFCISLAMGFSQRRHYESEIKWRDKSISELFTISGHWAATCGSPPFGKMPRR